MELEEGDKRDMGGLVGTVLWEHGHTMRSITESRAGLATLPRRQESGPKGDSAISQMTRPGKIIIVSEAMKPGEGVFSRCGLQSLPIQEFLFNQKLFPVYRVI